MPEVNWETHPSVAGMNINAAFPKFAPLAAFEIFKAAETRPLHPDECPVRTTS